jgi:hypothetical protein
MKAMIVEQRDAVLPLVVRMIHEIAVAGGAVEKGALNCSSSASRSRKSSSTWSWTLSGSALRAVDLVDDDDR